MNVEKHVGETDLEYQKRIISGKLVDKSLADYDYSELAKLIYGREYSSDVARRMFYGSKRTLDLMDSSDADRDSSKSFDYQINELKKERQKFYDERAALNKVIRTRARDEEINEIISRCISEAGLPQLPYSTPTYDEGDNDLIVSLSDIHYGAEVSNFWNEYNSDICAMYMSEYANKIINIGKTHNSNDCYVFGAGDFISGSIHKSIQITNKENVVKQVIGVSELISQFLAEIAQHFNNVYFVSVAGNHSRMDKKDDALYDERLDDLVEWYAKARLQNVINVKFDWSGKTKIDASACLFSVRGKTYCGVHGDYDSSKQKIQSLRLSQPYDIYALLLGHKHHNSTDTFDGIKVIISGSFLGTDDFCVKNRIFGDPEQIVCVCNSEGILCHYDIAL